MPSRPTRLAGFAAGIAALGIAAGCASPAPSAPPGPSTAPPRPSPSSSRLPMRDLMAARPSAKWPIFHFTIQNVDGGETGVIDPPDKIAEYVSTRHYTKPTYTSTETTLFTSAKAWLKERDEPDPAGYVPVPRQWMLLDSKKIRPGGPPFVYNPADDLGFTNVIIDGVSDLTETSPGHFSGVTDLEGGAPREVISSSLQKALGDQVDALRFTAAVDGQGHLTRLSIALPAAGKFHAGSAVITYDGFGTTAVPRLPARAEQINAPAYIDKWFS